MSDIRSTFQTLARQFAVAVLDAIRASSLEEILAETTEETRRPGRPPVQRGPGRPAGSSWDPLPRRSTNDLSKVADAIVALVKEHPKGLRAEQIRAELGIDKREWMRPLGMALASKKLTKKGEKRSTTYFAS